MIISRSYFALTQNIEAHINSHRFSNVIFSCALVNTRLKSLNLFKCHYRAFTNTWQWFSWTALWTKIFCYGKNCFIKLLCKPFLSKILMELDSPKLCILEWQLPLFELWSDHLMAQLERSAELKITWEARLHCETIFPWKIFSLPKWNHFACL